MFCLSACDESSKNALEGEWNVLESNKTICNNASENESIFFGEEGLCNDDAGIVTCKKRKYTFSNNTYSYQEITNEAGTITEISLSEGEYTFDELNNVLRLCESLVCNEWTATVSNNDLRMDFFDANSGCRTVIDLNK